MLRQHNDVVISLEQIEFSFFAGERGVAEENFHNLFISVGYVGVATVFSPPPFLRLGLLFLPRGLLVPSAMYLKLP